MNPTPANSYDEVPYDSHPFAQTHPSRLATVATLFGLTPAPVENCRVLELGCASGGNLLPMAEAFPDSRFVGIDYSARQIADAERVARVAGLANVSLRHASILDIDDTYGVFDYILCHGVFSWVADDVRAKILSVCSERLAPHGVAFVSYNTYPGWHMRGMIRDMMRYHAVRFDTPARRIQQARALLDFLASSAKNDTGPYGTLLRSELEVLRKQTDQYLYHEHLEDVNDPVYFHQFVELAHRHNLRYLGEARPSTMVMGNFGPEVRKALEGVSADQVQAEQYLDFVRNRTFRETLLVPLGASPNWTIKTDSLHRLHVTVSKPFPADSGDVRSADTVQYQTASGMTLSTSNPILKAAMRVLAAAWPATVAYPDLVREVVELAGGGTAGVDQSLGVGLLNTYLSADLIELHAAPIPPVGVGERPAALAVARARLASGEEGVANRRHALLRLSDLDRRILPLLDGTRDRAAVIDRMAELAAAGELNVSRQGEPVTDPAEIRGVLGPTLEQALDRFATSCLLKS
jgi:methyltransferase-like protein/SAM-dependent methyltransferase